MVAMAAWVSNNQDSEDRLGDPAKVEGLIKFLYRNRHMSPFEHGQFTFKVEAPLFVVREWHRHRTHSYNEMSGRYTIMPGRFYIPPRERPLVQDPESKIGSYQFADGDDEQYAILRVLRMRQATEQYKDYERLLQMGFAKEVARQHLGLNLMTQFYDTVNPRNLMAFLDLRAESQALWEIRQAANDIKQIFEYQMPLTAKAYNGT